MKSFFFLFFFLPFLGLAQHSLTIEVHDVTSSKGKVSVAVYNRAKSFLKFDKVYMNGSAAAQKGTTQVTITNIPKGTYALAVFHDENGNDALDTNWLGIPKEDVGFSNAKMKTFGPPSFEECALQLNKDQRIKVTLK